ncbi:GGDEF domain-containing protein [Campylobacter sp.]|uniref:GGDEF domain-containing protein n=1 Tax=Campylobacter sp. TaxID=205 RepID=UPI002703873A|nr:GGDEF domain-containing protein [Campylobacter sp.]
MIGYQKIKNSLQNTEKTPFYFWLIFVGLLIHIAFQFIFMYNGNKVMMSYNIISIIVFGGALKFLNRYQKIAVLLCFIEATVFTTVSTVTLGWHMGFQNWFIPFIILSITVPFKERTEFYALGVFQAILYLYLYFETHLKIPIFQIESINDFLLRFNLICSFILIFFTERVLKISKAMEVIFLQNEIKHMRNMVRTDELTGLTTRRQMNDILNKINMSSKEEDEIFYLVFGDIDNFKKVNDTYGHDCGDVALAEISNILKSECRSNDIVSRWGGEEFLILLREDRNDHRLNKERVEKILNRIRKKIEEKVIKYNDIKFSVTITFGGVSSACFNDIQKMIRAADEQMYIGKKNGRNQVVIK